MTNSYRYTLQKAGKKHNCPGCGKKTFVRYVDLETANYLPDQFGRCDREINCAYHMNPFKEGYAKKTPQKEWSEYSKNLKSGMQTSRINNIVKPELTSIPKEILKQTMQADGYEQNVFMQNLLLRIPFPFEVQQIEQVISQYFLGTVSGGYRAGAITFPYIDANKCIRAIQVKEFDKTNHTISTDFLHSIIMKEHLAKKLKIPDWLIAYQKNTIKVSCLFGEHLLSQYPMNPIALVEAPKTAIYGTLYLGFPHNPNNLLWLAVYNLSSLNFEKCKELKGRVVYLFPDLSKDGKAFQLWSNKAKELNEQMPGTRFEVSDMIERNATDTDRSRGFDLADFLTNLDWRKFRPQINDNTISQQGEKSEKRAASETNYFINIEAVQREEVSQKPQPTWNISELELFYNGILIPAESIQLDKCTTIIDISRFIDGHLAFIKANKGNMNFMPYFKRLKELSYLLGNYKN